MMYPIIYGRHKTKSSKPKGIQLVPAWRLFILTMILFGFLLFQSPGRDIYVEAIKNSYPRESTVSFEEPFGYFQGEWNLWEYLGDLIAYLMTQ